jgi:hypothetical protein
VAHACEQVNEICSSVKNVDSYDQLCDYFLVKRSLLYEICSFVVFLVAAADVIRHCNNKLWSFSTVNNKDSQPSDIFMSP